MKNEYKILTMDKEAMSAALKTHAADGWGVHTANLDDPGCFVFLLSRIVADPPPPAPPPTRAPGPGMIGGPR